jgi:hypothetical protein
MKRLVPLVLFAAVAVGCDKSGGTPTEGSPTTKPTAVADGGELAAAKRVAQGFLNAVAKGDHEAAAVLCSKKEPAGEFRPDLRETVRLLRRDPPGPVGLGPDWEIKSAKIGELGTTAEVDGRILTTPARPTFRMWLRKDDTGDNSQHWRVLSFIVGP